MRELEPAGPLSIDATRSLVTASRARFPLSRAAFAVSLAVHALGGYALSRQVWPSSEPSPPLAEFFLFEMPRPRPPEAVPEPVPPPEQPAPDIRQSPPEVAPQPPPRATEAVEPPGIIVGEPPVQDAPPPRRVPTLEELDEARQRAAREVVSERAVEDEYLTFSIDDVAPPRPAAEPEPERSIFDPGPGTRGPSLGTVGQARTKLGHRVSELCNALTGGFSLMGFGSFCAKPNDEPTGLFPEVMPAYLKMLPECVDTRDTAPALALEAPFSTVKCKLVPKDELEPRDIEP
jgi:hypothetical protein